MVVSKREDSAGRNRGLLVPAKPGAEIFDRFPDGVNGTKPAPETESR